MSGSESRAVDVSAAERRGQRFVGFLLAALRIVASTIALVELLQSDWAGGLSASLAWLLFVQVERRWNGRVASSEDGSPSEASGSSSR